MGRPAVREGTFPGGLPYLHAGDGPPLVVLSGLMPAAGHPRGLARLAESQLLRAFAQRRSAHAVNRPCGLAAGTTIAELAALHAHALRAAFGAPVDVIGISTGGSIAQQLALDHPDAVRRLVIASSGARLLPAAADAQRELAACIRRGDRRGAYRLMAGDVLGRGPLRTLLGAFMWLAGPALYPSAGDLSDMATTILAEDGFDARPRLASLRVPALVVGGARDRFYGTALLEETAGLIPGAQLIVYPRRGHVGALADARFARDVLAFLAA